MTLGELAVPGADTARIPIVLDAARRLRQANPDIALYGLITGPFTLALHLLGTDIFMRMFDDPDDVGRLLEFARDVALAIGENTAFTLAPGCDIPFATPPENLEAVGRLARDPDRQETVRAQKGDAAIFFTCREYPRFLQPGWPCHKRSSAVIHDSARPWHGPILHRRAGASDVRDVTTK